MHILVTGAHGQVGSELQALQATYPQWSFVFTDRDALDISDVHAVNRFFEQAAQRFDYCINCAAYTAVDRAESERALATAINVDGPRFLAQACQYHQVRLLHLSTDYVYHSLHQTPYVETDLTAPQSVYGSTKLQGELAAQAACAATLIVRTSWVYSRFGNNFVKTMVRLGQERDALSVVVDQVGTPTYARDLAQALLHLIEQHPDTFEGVYHYSNEGVCSWYDFAHAIFELKNIQCQLSPIPTKDYPTPAQRPPYSVLDKTKIKTTFGLTIPHWRDSLRACLEGL